MRPLREPSRTHPCQSSRAPQTLLVLDPPKRRSREGGPQPQKGERRSHRSLAARAHRQPGRYRQSKLAACWLDAIASDGFQHNKPRPKVSAALSLILSGLIVTVNVGLEVQTAVLVYPRREIDDVHGHLLLELHVALGAGAHRGEDRLLIPLRIIAQ